MVRCSLRRIGTNKKGRALYAFRTGKGKKATECEVGKAAARMHMKRFGGTGSKKHIRHAHKVHMARVKNLAKARAAKNEKKYEKRYSGYKSAGGRM